MVLSCQDGRGHGFYQVRAKKAYFLSNRDRRGRVFLSSQGEKGVILSKFRREGRGFIMSGRERRSSHQVQKGRAWFYQVRARKA